MKNSKLNRDSHSRLALFRGQISSLIEHEEIVTTAGKAKVVKSLFEKMLSKARVGSIPARRSLQSVLVHDHLVKKIVGEIAPRFKESKGGYTKTTMVGARRGDGAMLVKLSLTKRAEVAPKKVADKKSGKAEAPKAAAPKVATPRIAKPTKTVTASVNKAAMVRKTGER